MTRSTPNRVRAFIVTSFALAPVVMFSGCAVPLAPGYQVQKESLTVHFIPDSVPHLALRADYRLQNVGTAPLDFVEVTLPGEKSFGLANLRTQLAGKEATAEGEQSVTGGTAPSQSLWRIPLPGSLRQKRRIDITLEYDLAAEPAADPRIFVGAEAFYLNDSGWFPTFQEPKALLRADIVRPNPTELTVIVPAHFHVTASGEGHGAKTRNAGTEYRFRIGSSDFDPYILAGQYHEQKISTGGTEVIIWTFHPMPARQAHETAAPIAAARKFYAHNFGHLPKSMNAIYDVQMPENVGDPDTSLLPGVIFDWGLGARGSIWAAPSHAPATFIGQMELAQSWFAHRIVPRPEAWTLSDGFSFYAANLLEESNRTATSRAETIHTALSDYDRQRAKAVEKPVVSLAPTDPEDQRALAGDKADLFFFALVDKCGRQNLTHAISHMVYALRGQQYGYVDFRAALEEECHQDLAGFFRSWLNQKGIPADFRARWENPNAK